MTTSRLAILLAVLLGGLSAIFLLPKGLNFQPVGIDLDLPKMVGGAWYGRELKISDLEIDTLGRDTEFSRKSYTNARGDEVQVSVVLSGQDMNTSIHRPERCLPAQGWTIADSSPLVIPIGERGAFTATRLYNMRVDMDRETKKPRLGRDGKPVTIHHLSYYWFVGNKETTPSHFTRTWIDISDRLTHGYNQRWAYVTVSATITEGFMRDGLNEEKTDAMLKDFIKRLVPMTHKETVKF